MIKKLITFIFCMQICVLCFADANILFETKGKYVDCRAEESVNIDFVKQVDYIYEIVCEAFGLPKKSIDLKITLLKRDIDNLYGVPFPLPQKSLYSSEENMIYISLESITDGMMAHEITHALVFKELEGKGTLSMHEALAKYGEYFVIKRAKEKQDLK